MGYIIDHKYNSLGRFDAWDKETKKAIRKRISGETGGKMNFRFLTKKEGSILNILTDVLVEQAAGDQRIKIAEIIDQGLSDKKGGVRYLPGPWRGKLYKDGLADISEEFKKFRGKSLASAKKNEAADFVSEILADKKKKPAIAGFILKVLADSAAIYYSHPASWNKIGFPGPAFPEGYAYLDCKEAEDWEPKYYEKK
jgi:hypothetical protein